MKGKKMHIARISTMNFYGVNNAVVKDAAKMAEKKAGELLKPAEDFVNYTQSSYSVPTGDFPSKQLIVKRYPFSPEDNVISNEYIKGKKEEAKKAEEEVVEFISESSMM